MRIGGSQAAATATAKNDAAASIRQTSELEQKVGGIFLSLRLAVYRYLLGVVGRREEAEEITQEVFLSLYTTLQKGTNIANCRAWIFRVAHNMAINFQKRPAVVESVQESEWQRLCESRKDPSGDGEQRLLADERHQRVGKAMERLSPQERHCLNLRAEGLCFREIADVLGIRISTVETFIDRGIKKIARELNES